MKSGVRGFIFFRFLIPNYWVLLAIGLTVALGDGAPVFFVHLGSTEIIPNQFDGYDGQFSYLIALDPLGARDQMDYASSRYQRIMCPLLAWALSF